MKATSLHWGALAQLFACTAPPMTLLYLGQPRLAARLLVGLLAVVMGLNVLRGKRYDLAVVAVGCLPVVSVLRGIFFYYSGLCILGGALVMWMLHSPDRLRMLWNDWTWRSLAIFSVLYWWLCILITGDWVTQLRFFELTLSSAAILLLAENFASLATALFGMSISTTLMAIALLPYGDRLGLAFIDDIRVGNPILLGVPAMLMLMLVLADGGRWLLLEGKLTFRVILGLVMVIWLVLSGSRGSWVAAGCGILLVPLASKRDRGVLAALLVVAVVVVTLGLSTSRGAAVTNQFQRTIDSDMSLAKRTSGRSEQWSVLPAVFAESPLWGWGPGTGRDVNYLYTGRHLEWHSLYLQFVADAGMIGGILLVWFVWALIIRGIKYFRRTKEIIPLLALLTYLILAQSVQGVDAISGVFIGLALLGQASASSFRIKGRFRIARREPEPAVATVASA